jgi:hypothetical protein
MIRSLCAALLLCALSSCASDPVFAKSRHAVAACVETGTVMQPSCMGNDFLAGVKSIRVRMRRERRAKSSSIAAQPPFFGSRIATSAKNAHVGDQASVVSHPPGCPTRSFCGCGAAVRIFGHPVRELWLAANWFRFPRTSPAPGMAAVRQHHVFVLERHLGGDRWLAYDANSGRHLTRLHPRSIAGYAIVNPRGAG